MMHIKICRFPSFFVQQRVENKGKRDRDHDLVFRNWEHWCNNNRECVNVCLRLKRGCFGSMTWLLLACCQYPPPLLTGEHKNHYFVFDFLRYFFFFWCCFLVPLQFCTSVCISTTNACTWAILVHSIFFDAMKKTPRLYSPLSSTFLLSLRWWGGVLTAGLFLGEGKKLEADVSATHRRYELMEC